MWQNMRGIERSLFSALWQILEVTRSVSCQYYCSVKLLIPGLMGLCMGFSFVSLAEIFYYVLRGLLAAEMKKEKEIGLAGTFGDVGNIY